MNKVRGFAVFLFVAFASPKLDLAQEGMRSFKFLATGVEGKIHSRWKENAADPKKKEMSWMYLHSMIGIDRAPTNKNLSLMSYTIRQASKRYKEGFSKVRKKQIEHIKVSGVEALKIHQTAEKFKTIIEMNEVIFKHRNNFITLSIITNPTEAEQTTKDFQNLLSSIKLFKF